MSYNEFEGKSLKWDQPFYKDQTSGPQCGLSLEVSLYRWMMVIIIAFAKKIISKKQVQ